MKKAIKWILIIGGFLAVVVIAMLLLIPVFLDVQKYKPYIERRVSESAGRPFTMGEELQVSLFPWAGISLSDLHLGNPPGFDEKDFISIKSFEIRVKLLPFLLSKFKDIQISHILLNEPRIALIKHKDGYTTWKLKKEDSRQISNKEGQKSQNKETSPMEGEYGKKFSIKSLAIGDLTIKDGLLLWIDHTKKEKKKISNLNLQLQDVSLNRPVNLTVSAQMDGKPVSIKGNIGPVGETPGKGKVPLDISVNALKQIAINLKGHIDNPAQNPKFDLNIDVSPFSPRKMLVDTDMALPVNPSDAGVLNKIALKANIKGDPENISVSDGIFTLDESKFNFSVNAKNFSRPDVTFDVDLDHIDLDRYLPPKAKEKPGEIKKIGSTKPATKKAEYAPLRQLILKGVVHVGRLKVNNAAIKDINVRLSGRNGVFHINPLTMKLYKGDISGKVTLDVKKDTPKSQIKLQVKNIEFGPLIRDILEKDLIEGAVNAQITLGMAGEDAVKIKKTLNGKGELIVKEGAVKGIDLVAMVRNTDGAYGFAGKEKPETRFDELNSSFTITNGVFRTTDTRLVSTLIRVAVSGKSDLVGETLKFRIEPVIVTTSKADKKKMKRSEVMVPVLVSGTFSSPKFRPDLKAIAKEQLEKEVFESKKVKKIFKKKKYAPYEDAAKSLLKGLLDEKE